jgi:hypothetical protein
MKGKDAELKAKDKVLTRMTREGAVEENLTQGTTENISKRLKDAELVDVAVVSGSEILPDSEEGRLS